MFVNFQASTADEVWMQINERFHSGDSVLDQASRVGPTKELLHSTISIFEPRQRWVVSRNPPLNIAFAIAEIVWIMTGRNDAQFLNYFNSKLPEFAGKSEKYHGAYGYRLRNHFGIDQLERAYLTLKSKPDSRQVVLQYWDARSDLPDDNGLERNLDIPCNVMSLLKVRDEKLEWTQIMRSNDLFLGLPHNIIQFTCLQEIVAGWLGIELGHYNHLSDSLHLYEKDIASARNSFPITGGRNSDILASPKADSEQFFLDIAGQIDFVLDPEVGAKDLMDRSQRLSLAEAFKNFVFVIFAEGARRRKEVEIMNKLISQCSNPIYCQMYARWIARVNAG